MLGAGWRGDAGGSALRPPPGGCWVSILSRTMCALYGNRAAPFLIPPLAENGFAPPGPPLVPAGDGRMDLHDDIQYSPNMRGSGGSSPSGGSRGAEPPWRPSHKVLFFFP